jgi:hypothetical protein
VVRGGGLYWQLQSGDAEKMRTAGEEEALDVIDHGTFRGVSTRMPVGDTLVGPS